jgi:hypothetical protein
MNLSKASLVSDPDVALNRYNALVLEHSQTAQDEYFANLASDIDNKPNKLTFCISYFNDDYMQSLKNRPVFRKLLARFLAEVLKEYNATNWNKYI